MDQVSTSMAEMSIDEDGILHIRIKKGVHFTLEKAQEHYDSVHQFTGGKKMLVLVEASEEYTISEEAGRFINSEEANRGRIAVAFVTRSIANRLLFNFVMSFSRHPLPRKMFSDKEKALKWLKTFYILPGERFIRKKRKGS